jgi:hypothetical protein
MPLTRLFFQRYCEDITDYQIRRMALAARSLVQRVFIAAVATSSLGRIE